MDWPTAWPPTLKNCGITDARFQAAALPLTPPFAGNSRTLGLQRRRQCWQDKRPKQVIDIPGR
jgi:hypothetical protein